MKLKLEDYKLYLLLFLMLSSSVFSQYRVTGVVTTTNNKSLNKVQIFDDSGGYLTQSDSKGKYTFITDKNQLVLIFYVDNYQLEKKKINFTQPENTLDVVLAPLSEELSEVVIKAQKKKVFELTRLKDVEQTAIYAGKKTEVVLLNQATVNLATNNARQIYSQVAGLNIFENDDAGLQLNIGGRGLDPNRTSNFNTRQNGYDISADVLGYPESYYSPPAEAIEEIQIVRGAASLQYGTQFGGLVNFKFKKPNPNKLIEVITRNTLGSFDLYTNYTSISGTKDKFSYFAYYNYKSGDGFRANSGFESTNFFTHFGYDISPKTKVEAEFTYLGYLAQQAGGLNDNMFNEDPYQSNRKRNWFKVAWHLYSLKFMHDFSEKTKVTFNFFGLDASRKAVGVRTRRVDQEDVEGGKRELLKSDFKNFGLESRFLTEYKLFGKKITSLLGVKYYNAANNSVQGSGSLGSDADFTLANNLDPKDQVNYSSDYDNPNENVAIFGEDIIYINEKLSITPGVRYEYIATGNDGYSRALEFDAAGNLISDETQSNKSKNIRQFLLFGVGLSYKPTTAIELYGNLSQNYRSITFSDVNIVNPSNAVDPNLQDEKGYTIDIGFRGNFNRKISYDMSAFALFYNNKIGNLLTQIPPINNLGQLRTNVGDARVLGIESMIDFNIQKLFDFSPKFSTNLFVNTSFINSEYTRSILNGFEGNKLQFVPDVNLKAGLRFGYENFSSSLQYTYLSEQFTDATNALGDRLTSVEGHIPSYDILDFSASYRYKSFKFETGINNLLNKVYFTRRATGYPGPGIIPSAPRSYYFTLALTF